MPRTKEQNAIYMRRYRRKKRLAKLGVVDSPHMACDIRINELGIDLRRARAVIQNQERMIAEMKAELADPLGGVFE